MALSAILAGTPAIATVIDSVNALRTQGCGRHAAVESELAARAQLDDAARRLSRGTELGKAVADSGYRATRASSIHIQTSEGERGIERILAQRFCDLVTDAAFSDIGVERHGGEVWVVLAAPFAAPTAGDAAVVQQRVLELVNEARAKPRRCGRMRYPAAGPLRHSVPLERAAATHARDMAARRKLGHHGGDGSEPAERATRAGYQWRAVAENIAAGATTAEQVVSDWLASPGHCQNLMDPRFTEMGVAYALDPGGRDGIYWAQVLAVRQTAAD